MKPVIHGESKTNVLVGVVPETNNATSIGSFDMFVYYSDSGSLYAVEAY